jgi:hypothetical protein
LLDNWGFVHVLYHHSPALLSLPTGWTLVQGHRLAELAPAPIYPEVWQAAPDVILGLLAAPARPVRRWAIGLLKRDHAAVLAALPAGTLVGWLAHPSPEMVAFGVELLRARPGGLGSLPLEQWLALLEQAPPEALDHLLGLLGDHLRSAARSVGPAVRLASARSPSLAAFGFEVLRSLELNSEEECRAVLGLREAACETLRPQLIRWACEATSRSPYFRPDFVLELLDARFADVRAAGWAWLDAEPRARDEVSLWRRLLESPYDDVRLPLLDRLQSEAGARSSENDKGTPGAAVDAPALVRQLWATILLNVVRGGRRKPAAIGQVLGRLTGRPEEAGELLPVLAAAVRSIRGPEFRAGLTGLVRVVARRPELADAVRAAFPELDLRPAGVI